MLTKRNLFMMMTIIAVVLVIFLSSVVLKEYYNDYSVNHMAPTETVPKKEEHPNADSDLPPVYCLGNEDNGYLEVIREWTEYRKKALTVFSSVGEVGESLRTATGEKPCLLADGLLLDNNTESAVQMLTEYVCQGGVLIFYRLPSYGTIRDSAALQNLLGIQRLRAEAVQLKEIRLYKGFLLGGETHYSFEAVSDPALADMDREIPWYDVSSRTKTYMVGFLSEDVQASLGLHNEDMPAIIWRSNMENGSVFAVNGDYMQSSGLGILDAMLYESQEYSLYPVVNAQNLSVTGFPSLTAENEEQMAAIYGMTSEQFCRDILWSSLVAAAHKGNWRMTAFVSVKQSDAASNKPNTDIFIDYLKYLNEESAEAGVSLGRIGSADIRRSVSEEKAALEELELDYLFAGGYLRNENRKKLADLLDSGGKMRFFGDIRTVVGEYTENGRILGWLTDSITLQNVTSNAYQHSFRDNLRLKSIETALGYSNVQVDIYRVLNPASANDEWEAIADKMASNIDTYWKPFSAFDKTTVSQSDARVRSFLNGSVQSEKNGNCISVKTADFSEDAYLLFRTHGEQIADMTGGTFTQVEEDAYLLRLTSDTANITLKSQTELFYKE